MVPNIYRDLSTLAKYKLKTAKTTLKSKFHLDDIEIESVELKINRTDQRVFPIK